MNRTKAKQLRKLAQKIREGKASDKFRTKTGALMHSGDSVEGTYKELKKEYLRQSREGLKPWIKLNRGEMF